MHPTHVPPNSIDTSDPGPRRLVPARVAAAGLGMVPVGAAAGALAGALGSMLWAGLFGGSHDFHVGVFTIAAIIGAPLGAVILPMAGFTVLRRVPIGRALWQTIVGTALGGVIGVQFLTNVWVIGPLAGFALAAGRLWREARRDRLESSHPWTTGVCPSGHRCVRTSTQPSTLSSAERAV